MSLEGTLAEQMNRLRGRTLGMVESWNLDERQEVAIKQLIKTMTYDSQQQIAIALNVPPVPHGKCGCGCGEATQPYKSSRADKGQVKGEPQRFVKGHFTNQTLEIGYEINDDSGCWEWTKATDPHGYGRIGREGKVWLAHRYMYTMFRGDIEEGQDLHHTCNNPSCVNPKHLTPVSPEDHAHLTRNRLKIEALREISKEIKAIQDALDVGDVDLAKTLSYDSQRLILETLEELPE